MSLGFTRASFRRAARPIGGRRPSVPEGLVAEIVDGELMTSPRLRGRHAAASSSVQSGLFAAFERRGAYRLDDATWVWAR
jgi:hypothetical protein